MNLFVHGRSQSIQKNIKTKTWKGAKANCTGQSATTQNTISIQIEGYGDLKKNSTVMGHYHI